MDSRFRGFVAGAWLCVVGAAPSSAQQVQLPGASGDGTLLFHGNYCGPGNNGLDKPAVDKLDLACRHHDLCYGPGPVAPCACNAALAREASAVATSPMTDPDVAVLSGVVANGALALPCHP